MPPLGPFELLTEARTRFSGYAARGITAGSGIAITAVRILMQEVVLLTLSEWVKDVDITLCVDDITMKQQVMLTMRRAETPLR